MLTIDKILFALLFQVNNAALSFSLNSDSLTVLSTGVLLKYLTVRGTSHLISVAQSVAHLTQEPGFRVRYPVRPHTFVSPVADSRRQLSVCARSTG